MLCRSDSEQSGGGVNVNFTDPSGSEPTRNVLFDPTKNIYLPFTEAAL